MILTITLNPSIDIRYNLSHFETGKVHRAINCEKTAGGKGLNVARVIKKLNCEVLATGLLGGKLGEDLAEKLNLQGIKMILKRFREKQEIVLIFFMTE